MNVHHSIHVNIYKPSFNQTCIKRSVLGQRKKWSSKTSDLLIKVSFIWNFLWQEKKKKGTFNIGDCLIEVTTWASFTVFPHIHVNTFLYIVSNQELVTFLPLFCKIYCYTYVVKKMFCNPSIDMQQLRGNNSYHLSIYLCVIYTVV